jgi:MSHA biogenesis protein MshP
VQTSSAATQEVISIQTFYAAESGAQRGMQALFFPDASSRQQADARCAGAVNTTHSFVVDGLKNCVAVVTCSCAYADGSSCSSSTAANYSTSAATVKLTSFYTIASAATCGSGSFRAERTVDVGAFLAQE